MANPIFTYRELGAIMENSAFYIKDWENGTVLTSQYMIWGHLIFKQALKTAIF